MPTQAVQRGITRYDKDVNLANGYMVRVTRDGHTHSRFFSDTRWGGKRKALRAARAGYEEMVAELPEAKTTKGVKTARNRSGQVGVHLAESESSNGELYQAYCASWPGPRGRRRKISFSFKKYGKRKAYRLACLAREQECHVREKVEQEYERLTGKGPRGGTRPRKKR